jgi:hypothetical protein
VGAALTEAAKTVRIVTLNAGLQKANHVRVVNVETVPPVAHEFPTYLQALTAAQKNEYPEWMTTGVTGTVANGNGLPHIYIKNYSGPS